MTNNLWGNVMGEALPAVPLESIEAWLVFVAEFAVVVGIVIAVARWLIKRQTAHVAGLVAAANQQLSDDLRRLTKQIQPGANGGEALADVAKTAEETKAIVLRLREDVMTMRESAADWRDTVDDRFDVAEAERATIVAEQARLRDQIEAGTD